MTVVGAILGLTLVPWDFWKIPFAGMTAGIENRTAEALNCKRYPLANP